MTRNEFKRDTEKAFSFLVNDYGFRKSRISTPANDNMTYIVEYLGQFRVRIVFGRGELFVQVFFPQSPEDGTPLSMLPFRLNRQHIPLTGVIPPSDCNGFAKVLKDNYSLIVEIANDESGKKHREFMKWTIEEAKARIAAMQSLPS